MRLRCPLKRTGAGLGGIEPPVATHIRTHRSAGQLFNISFLWLSLSFWWSGVLGILLPIFVAGLVPDQSKGGYLSLIAAAGASLSSAIQLVVGPLSDRTYSRFGRRVPYIFVGIVLSLPAVWLFFYAPLAAKSFSLLMLAYCWVQVWMNVANGPYQALIPDLVPENRQGLASAYMGIMSLVGQAGGFIAIAILKDTMWTLCGLTIALLALGVVQTSATCHENLKPHRELGRFQLRHIADVRFRQFPDFTWLIISRFFINLAFYTALTFLLYYLKDALGSKDPTADMVKLALIVSFAGAAGTWPAGKLADRISKKAIVYFTCALLSASAIAFVFNASMVWAFVIAGGFGLAWGAFMAVDWALASNLVPRTEEGKYMAVWHLAFTVPQVVAPWLGPVADWANATWPASGGIGWRIAFAFMPLYLGIGAWSIRHVRERKPSES